MKLDLTWIKGIVFIPTFYLLSPETRTFEIGICLFVVELTLTIKK
jgi:hypothetical protein